MFSLLTSTRLTLPGSMNICPISLFFFFFFFALFLSNVYLRANWAISPLSFTFTCSYSSNFFCSCSFLSFIFLILVSSLLLTARWTKSWNLSSSSVGFLIDCLYLMKDWLMPLSTLLSASCKVRRLYLSYISCSFWIVLSFCSYSLGSELMFLREL